MRRAWIITNPASGSSGDDALAAVEWALTEAGVTLAGRTVFPDEALPTGAALETAQVDTAVLLAGDGTINAAACLLADWTGEVLVLPGGTMNMLARALHGEEAAPAIVAAAAARGRLVALPTLHAADHCAFVGMILGPAATWSSVRERVRKGRWRGIARAVAHAWRRTFSRGLRLDGLPGRVQAALLRPQDEAVAVTAIDARDFRAIAALGWQWLRGDWLAAAAVTAMSVPELTLRRGRPVHALVDGEPHMLPPGTVIRVGRSRAIFLSTLAEATP